MGHYGRHDRAVGGCECDECTDDKCPLCKSNSIDECEKGEFCHNCGAKEWETAWPK